MLTLFSAVAILCALFQIGYLQESHVNPSSTVQHGIYPYWPFQAQIINGNYNPNHRKVKKPCIRRMNSNDPISGEAGSQWIPTYTSRIVKPLKENNLIFNSRSLKDSPFNSMVASNKVVESVTDKPLPNSINEPEIGILINNDPCDTTPTTKDVDEVNSKSGPEPVEPNHDYTEQDENKNEQDGYNYHSTVDERSENLHEDCNNKIEPTGNSRRFLTQHEQELYKPTIPVTNEQGASVLNMNRTELKKETQLLGNNNVRPYLQGLEEPVDSRLGLTNPRPNDVEGNLMEPTKGRGISQMTDGKVMLMQNTKVCYACSSVSDPTCWHPDRRTTVKYCRVGHDSCVSKTIRNTNGLIVIRDCARSCDDNDVTGLISRYKSCSICHYDLCNSAYSIRIHNIILFSSMLAFIKYLL